MESQIRADPAVLRLQLRQLCYLGGLALQSGEIIGSPKSKDDMPADLADSQNAHEKDRKSDHATLCDGE